MTNLKPMWVDRVWASSKNCSKIFNPPISLYFYANKLMVSQTLRNQA